MGRPPWAALVTSAALLATPPSRRPRLRCRAGTRTSRPTLRGPTRSKVGMGWPGRRRASHGQALLVESEPGRTPRQRSSAWFCRRRRCGLSGAGLRDGSAEDVGSPPNSWNGIKCMLAIETPDRKLWPQADVGTGTFDWRRLRSLSGVPTNHESRAGPRLEQVSGKVWFDDVEHQRREAAGQPGSRGPLRPAFNGHAVSRLRGAMVSPNIDAAGCGCWPGLEGQPHPLAAHPPRSSGQPSSLEDYDTCWRGN